jgi:putative acetyltransferase
VIRDEAAGDAGGIRTLLQQAFDSPVEADIVDALRLGCDDRVSLVADHEGEVAGHILFTPVEIGTAAGTVRGYGLAPMAVRPGLQRRGIGSGLVRAGLARVRASGAPFVIVIGHPAYYPRFGFVPASRFGVRCQWPGIPDEAVMLVVLDAGRGASLAGEARYRPEFDAAV